MRSRNGSIDLGLKLTSAAGDEVILFKNREDGAPELEFALFGLGFEDRESPESCYLLEVRTFISER